MSACPHDQHCLCPPVTGEMDRLSADLARSMYGDGGPLIVPPDWKPTYGTAPMGFEAFLPEAPKEEPEPEEHCLDCGTPGLHFCPAALSEEGES